MYYEVFSQRPLLSLEKLSTLIGHAHSKKKATNIPKSILFFS